MKNNAKHFNSSKKTQLACSSAVAINASLHNQKSSIGIASTDVNKSTKSWSWWFIILPVILLCMTILVYYASLSYPFEFDDLANIRKLFSIRHNTFGSLFFKSSRWISFWLNACYYDWLPAQSKFSPFLYRLGNLAFHCLTGLCTWLIVYLCCFRSKNSFLSHYSTLVAYITTGLFLLHPVQTQTISYVIQGQLEGLAGLFTMALITCFLMFTRARSRFAQCLSIITLYALAIIACGTKEIVIVSPLLIMLVDWFFVAQGEWRAFKSRLWLHGSLMMLILSLYIYFLKPAYFANILTGNVELSNNIGNVLTELPQQKITPYVFFISQFKVMVHYLWIFFWPFSMSVDYDWKLSRSFFAPDSLVPFLFLCCIAFFILARLRKNKTDVVSFGLLWFFIALLPRSTIIPSTELLADYKTYSASIGLLFVVAYVLVCGFARLKNSTTATLVLSTIFLAIVASTAYRRNLVWRSPEDFWLNIIENAPSKARAYNNYGVALCERNKHAQAVDYFKRAIALDHVYADPYTNISVAYAKLGDVDHAIESLKQSIRLMPYHPETYNNLATMLIEKGDYQEVEKTLGIATRLRPHYGKAYWNLGNYFVKIGEYEKALDAYKKCCTQADYDNEIGFTSHARMSFVLKKYDDAIASYQKVLAVAPASMDARVNLALLYGITKQYAYAEHYYKELIERNPKSNAVWFEYGNILFEQRKYQEALHAYESTKKIDATFAPVYVCVAKTLVQLGRTSEARTLMQMFIAQAPPEPEVTKARQLLASIG